MFEQALPSSAAAAAACLVAPVSCLTLAGTAVFAWRAAAARV